MHVAFDVAPLRPEPAGVGQFVAAMGTTLAELLGPDELTYIGRRADAVDLPLVIRSTPFRGGSYPVWLQAFAPLDVRASRADLSHFTQGMVPLVRTTRTIVSIHDMSLVRFRRYHPTRRVMQTPLVLAAPRLADVVMVPSRATADEVMRLTAISAKKIEVVPYGLRRGVARSTDGDIDRVLHEHGLARGGFILALGTIEPRKNLPRLVEAFELAARERSVPDDVQLVVAGKVGWQARQILHRLENSSVASRIRRLGFVPSDQLPALMSGAAAVAYVSLYEGFGLPVLEALACGAATVTSRTSSMPEVSGDAALLVNPWQPRDIARGLAEAVSAARSDSANLAVRSVRQASKFTWAQAGETTVELYRRVSA